MKISDFPGLLPYALPLGQVLYRVQTSEPHAQTTCRGAVHLHSGPERLGRFDLDDRLCAYFATRPQTALYEAVYRREKLSIKPDALEGRHLIAVAMCRELTLADLRPYASHFPVLQSERRKETRQLAEELEQQGVDGLIYRSAQQGEHDCVILFDPPESLFKLLWRSALSDIAGSGGAWSAVASQGARIPPKG